MTYAEELFQEGFEKGLALAREKGMLAVERAVLIRWLSRRFSLNDDDRSRIESCEDIEALDAALHEFRGATSKESVLAKLA